MRPINKGVSPYQSIPDYAYALPHLIDTIGCYCSYCEMNISHAPEVEHIFAKSKGGDITAWSNLLLACKYCNPRKGTIIGQYQIDRWLWPDSDNTLLAFSYVNSIPELNTSYLLSLGNDVYDRAKHVFEDLKLDNIPETLKDKDRRFATRLDVYNRANDALNRWLKGKSSPYESDFKQGICSEATALGFFSVWLHVFKEEDTICLALINAFKGTAQDCFDSSGKPIPRVGGKI